MKRILLFSSMVIALAIAIACSNQDAPGSTIIPPSTLAPTHTTVPTFTPIPTHTMESTEATMIENIDTTESTEATMIENTPITESTEVSMIDNIDCPVPSDGVEWVKERIEEKYNIEVDIPDTLLTMFDSDSGLYTFEGTAEYTVEKAGIAVTLRKDFVVIYDSADCSVKIQGIE